jgi:hypothetical protein
MGLAPCSFILALELSILEVGGRLRLVQGYNHRCLQASDLNRVGWVVTVKGGSGRQTSVLPRC